MLAPFRVVPMRTFEMVHSTPKPRLGNYASLEEVELFRKCVQVQSLSSLPLLSGEVAFV